MIELSLALWLAEIHYSSMIKSDINLGTPILGQYTTLFTWAKKIGKFQIDEICYFYFCCPMKSHVFSAPNTSADVNNQERWQLRRRLLNECSLSNYE